MVANETYDTRMMDSGGIAHNDDIDAGMHHYLNKPLLTKAEEIALAKRMEAGGPDGKAARDELITRNLRLVYYVAKRYHSKDPATEFQDLVQEGMTGLIKAADKYDWQRGTRFGSLAIWWIRQSISLYQNRAGTIRRTGNKHMTPSTERGKQLRELSEKPLLEIDAPLRHARNLTLGDVLPDYEDTEESALGRVMLDQVLNQVLDEVVPQKWHPVIKDWLAEYTYREAGARHGLSRGIITIAMQQIRDYYDVKTRKQKPLPRQTTVLGLTCVEKGCHKGRLVGRSGRVWPRCPEHQRENWRVIGAKRRSRKDQHDG
ncbi:MAG: sigma-70 family RNA polymerase sigma factor [Anaerolineae bacterium]|nr:sigma-70 family RNA polymerase sigma factor [Anaerolineae bacterium]